MTDDTKDTQERKPLTLKTLSLKKILIKLSKCVRAFLMVDQKR